MSNVRRHSASPVSEPGPSSSPGSPDASTPLILLPESQDPLESPFDFSSDDDDEQMFNPPYDPRRPVIFPLSPSVVFLYLLSPYLKLGVMLLPTETLSIKSTVLLLLFFAMLSAFSRHILYLLARHLRKTDLDDIFSTAFARFRDNERRREILRSLSCFCTGVVRVLLGAVYLRESSHIFLTLLPDAFYLPPQLIISIGIALFVIPLSVVHSLAAKPVIYATWASIATYVLWLACACYAHTRGSLIVNRAWLPVGSLWQGTTTIAFAFAASSPLHLYASLKATVHSVSTKTPRSRSFRTLSILSVSIALALVLPLAFFSYQPESGLSGLSLPHFMEILNAVTLVLAAPSILITAPPIPLPERIQMSTRTSLSRVIVYLAMFVLSLLPTSISGILGDALLISALSTTYFIPALLHVTIHHFSKPQTIFLTPGSPNRDTGRPTSPSHEELLRRKERALQKKHRMKRIVWDVGVWVLLVPIGGGGFVWAGGKLAGRW